MRASRRDALLKGQTAMACKVYDSTPIQESWTLGKIVTEAARKSQQLPMANAQAAIRALVDVGLVKEPSQGLYRRVGVREKDDQPEEENQTMPDTTTPSAAAAPASPLQILEGLARRCGQIAHLTQELASDIETAALNIQHHVEMSAEDQKLLGDLKSVLSRVKP